MQKLQIELMYEEASNRLHDAEILATKFRTKSDSQALLSLVAFEILLKAEVLIYCKRYNRNHDYQDLYKSLPQEVQERLKERAKHWAEISLDCDSLKRLLGTFKYNFMKLRYPFEAYKNMTRKEYTEYSDLWIELGASAEEAEIQYHPQELYGLTKALREDIKNYLDNN